MLQQRPAVHASNASASWSSDVEKNAQAVTQSVSAPSESRSTTGVTLFVKISTGMTKHLHADANLPTLLEGPCPNNPTKVVLRCDRLLLTRSGIG
jgi:hypothetical protein